MGLQPGSIASGAITSAQIVGNSVTTEKLGQVNLFWFEIGREGKKLVMELGHSWIKFVTSYRDAALGLPNALGLPKGEISFRNRINGSKEIKVGKEAAIDVGLALRREPLLMRSTDPTRGVHPAWTDWAIPNGISTLHAVLMDHLEGCVSDNDLNTVEWNAKKREVVDAFIARPETQVRMAELVLHLRKHGKIK